MRRPLRALVAEFMGTAVLLLGVVGSGATAWLGGFTAQGLLHHAVAVGATLAVLIVLLVPLSGAHLNPGVSMLGVMAGTLSPRLALGYVAAQLMGAVAGVVLANWLFGHAPLAVADVERVGLRLGVSEYLATIGLVVAIHGTLRTSPRLLPSVVGAYVAAAILFTPSAAFVNPAVTLARIWTPTATGIAPSGVPVYLAAQVAGALSGGMLVRFLYASPTATARQRPTDTRLKEEGTPP